MNNDGLTQHDSDIMIEEEMEIGTPASPAAPTPHEELPMQRGSKARDGPLGDQLSQTSEESMDKNPPQNSDLNEEELLEPVTDISVPGGHLDNLITLSVPPGEDNL